MEHYYYLDSVNKVCHFRKKCKHLKKCDNVQTINRDFFSRKLISKYHICEDCGNAAWADLSKILIALPLFLLFFAAEHNKVIEWFCGICLRIFFGKGLKELPDEKDGG